MIISTLIYQTDVTNNIDDENMYYLELAETTFKDRFGKYKTLFNKQQFKNSREVSIYV